MILVEVLFSWCNVRLIAATTWQMIIWQKTFEWQFWVFLCDGLEFCMIFLILSCTYFRNVFEFMLLALYCVSLFPRTSESCSPWSSLTWKVLLEIFWESGTTSWKIMVEQLGKHWEREQEMLLFCIWVCD